MPRTEPFDLHYDRYEEWFERHGPVYESELRAVRTLFPRSGLAAEVGVGSGRFAAPLGIRLGVEPSLAMARLARERGIQVARGVAEALPIRSGSLDVVLMVTTICFVDDPFLTFQEIGRVLKPGGHVLVGFIDKTSHLGQQYERIKEQNVFYRPATFYSTADILDLLSRTGFAELQTVQTVFRSLEEIEAPEPVEEGHGRGAFVVVRGRKRR